MATGPVAIKVIEGSGEGVVRRSVFRGSCSGEATVGGRVRRRPGDESTPATLAAAAAATLAAVVVVAVVDRTVGVSAGVEIVWVRRGDRRDPPPGVIIEDEVVEDETAAADASEESDAD